jgi:hypothetical protein
VTTDLAVVTDDTIAMWAQTVSADLAHAAQGIIAAGVHLIEAKAAVGSGWAELLEAIGISAGTASKFISIGKGLAAFSHCENLPASSETLYYLSRLEPHRLEAAIGDGVIGAPRQAHSAKPSVVYGVDRVHVPRGVQARAVRTRRAARLDGVGQRGGVTTAAADDPDAADQ